ncbi:MAG: OmpA family protein [Chloracidobacterium sp.]|nr:OmpA family protein [Chloracidobacterium sp.]
MVQVKNERGIVLTLPETLWTGSRSSTFVPQADGKLTALAEILGNNRDYRIAIESHTDNAGDPTANQSMTEKRSYLVADKFASLGIDEGRIVAKRLWSKLTAFPKHDRSKPR